MNTTTKSPWNIETDRRSFARLLAATAVAVVLAIATPANAADWTYYAAGAAGNPTNIACIADGTWILKASLSGTSLAVRGYVSGSGAMDLSKPVNGGAYSITEVGAFGRSAPVTVLTLPSMLERLTGETFRDCSSLGAVFGDTTNLVDIGSSAFRSCSALTNVAIVMSAVTNIGDWAFGGSPLSATDATVWQGLPALATLGAAAFSNCKMTGRLTLSSIRTLNDSVIRSTNLGELVIDSPYLTLIAGNSCNGNGLLTNLVLRTPALTNIANNAFTGDPLSATDVTDWDLSALLRLGNAAFSGKFTGTLSLPAVVMLETDAVRGPHISRLELGMKAHGPITISNNCFYGDSSLKSILVAGTNTISLIGINCFLSVSFTNVTFEGSAPASSVLNGILVSVAANASTHTCAIYASKHQTGWTDLAVPVNAAEEANWQTHWPEFTTGEGNLLGVYTNSVGRKAWIIHQASPADGHGGFVIRICDTRIAVPYDWATNACPGITTTDANATISNDLGPCCNNPPQRGSKNEYSRHIPVEC